MMRAVFEQNTKYFDSSILNNDEYRNALIANLESQGLIGFSNIQDKKRNVFFWYVFGNQQTR